MNDKKLTHREINRFFENTDLFLIDHILKGTFLNGKKILDAGCGEGRNLPFFIRNEYEVYGVDSNASALKMLKYTEISKEKTFNPDNFIQSDILRIPFGENTFDFIICISVLHFAENESHFFSMFRKLFSSLKPNGVFFLAMSSLYGFETVYKYLDDGKYMLPDGNSRFLFTRELDRAIREQFNFEMVEACRTVVIHGQESLTYMVMKKSTD